MEQIAGMNVYAPDAAVDARPKPDRRAQKLELAERLADNMRLGEAIRILEAMADCAESQELLARVRAMKVIADEAEAELKAEQRRQQEERRAQDARAKRREALMLSALAALGIIALWLLTR